MKWALAMWLVLLGGLAVAETATNGAPRFIAVDVFVDSQDKALAVYQVEFAVTNGVAKIVGIEGGESPAFREPPHYDPKAIQQERVILAAFNTSKQLPTGKTRVATVHLQVSGSVSPGYRLTLQVAADARGEKIPGIVSFEERKPK